MTPEQKLHLLLAHATPPARDFVFMTDVARRVALRRAWWGAAAMLPWLAISCVLLWALAPFLVAVWLKTILPMTLPVGALAGSALLATGVLWLTQRLSHRR